MIVISPLIDKDVHAVYEIEKLCFALPKSEQIFKNDQNKYYIARVDDKVVGYIGVEDIAGEKHIINMAVQPDFRRQGIARKLVEEVLNSKDVFFLEVRVSNFIAQELYSKYGFKGVGLRKSYYQDNSEDAIIMRRGLQ
ncbi:MAG: ribosomal protein S18-alanine N-acetyltransferase [Candidatus Margulisbacteria bacterium]|nr:ribosomal protein S18-alanine N-acetyltransferase [Candidatus Margulisiibacteriota bacterium]